MPRPNTRSPGDHGRVAKRVALFHHRPDRTDSEVERTLCRFAESPLPVMGAAETDPQAVTHR